MNESNELIFSEYINQRIKDRFEFKAKDKQINALRILLKNWNDVILIVRTEFEKSIIFQTTSLMFLLTKTALIIMSLNALKKKQCEKLKNINDYKLFMLNEDSHISSNITLIR